MTRRDPVVVRDGNRTVTVVPATGQSPASVEADIDRSLDFLDQLRTGGVETWLLRSRRIGPLRITHTKEVGPPPWRFPKLFIKASRTAFSCGAGWRSTCYMVLVTAVTEDEQ